MSKLTARSSSIVAVVCGSLLANLVPGLFGHGGLVQASWCWQIGQYTPGGYYSEGEKCCGDYYCFQAGQCSGNPAPSFDDALSTLSSRPGTDCAGTTTGADGDTITTTVTTATTAGNTITTTVTTATTVGITDVAAAAFDHKKVALAVLVLIGQCLISE